jgi:hypothetical protein
VKISVLALISFSSAAITVAQDLPIEAASLKGINGIRVIVEEPDDSVKALGLSHDAIQGDVELKHTSILPLSEPSGGIVWIGEHVGIPPHWLGQVSQRAKHDSHNPRRDDGHLLAIESRPKAEKAVIWSAPLFSSHYRAFHSTLPPGFTG